MYHTRAGEVITITLKEALSHQSLKNSCQIAYRIYLTTCVMENFSYAFVESSRTIVELAENAIAHVNDLESVAAFITLLHCAVKIRYRECIDQDC